MTCLCDLTNDNDTVTSVSWAERGNFVAVGTHRGYVQVQAWTCLLWNCFRRHFVKIKILTLLHIPRSGMLQPQSVSMFCPVTVQGETFQSSLLEPSSPFFNPEVWNLTPVHSRVGALAWNGDMLSSGSRDRFILQRDVRTPRLQSTQHFPCYPDQLHFFTASIKPNFDIDMQFHLNSPACCLRGD